MGSILAEMADEAAEVTGTEDDTEVTADAEPAPTKVDLPKAPPRRKSAGAEREALSKQVEELNKKFTESSTKTASELAARDAEIARLRGSYEALQSFSQRPAPAPAPPPVDPKALRRQARSAIDKGDFDEYERLTSEATIVEAESRIRALIPQQQAQQPRQVNYATQAVMNQYPDVMQLPNGLSVAVNYDNLLAAKGIPDTPERYKQAFELAKADLIPKANGKPAFSQSSRAALSGIPPARSTGTAESTGASGVRLSSYELGVAKKCGMTAEEYAAEVAIMHPERVTAD